MQEETSNRPTKRAEFQRKAIVYELFILSKLLHRPMHGYMIQKILNHAIGPWRSLSWGTLYPLMKKLEKSGFIVAQAGDEADLRGKKRYRTTEAGRARFLQFMQSREDYTTPELFRIKLGCFGHLDPESRLRVLAGYRHQLGQVEAHTVAMVDQVTLERNLPPGEKRFALIALEHQKTVTESEIRWVDSLIASEDRLQP